MGGESVMQHSIPMCRVRPRVIAISTALLLLLTLLGNDQALALREVQDLSEPPWIARVEGIVIDADSGFPILGAVVSIPTLGVSAESGPQGVFALSRIPLPVPVYTATVTASATDYGDWQLSDVRLYHDDVLRLHVRLTSEPVAITVPRPRVLTGARQYQQVLASGNKPVSAEWDVYRPQTIRDDWPSDAQSTTGPVPPPGIERGARSLLAPEAEAVLLDVPAYIWHNGCGPTAAGMVIGYWDGNGFDNLVSGSADTQTPAVDTMISSSGNYDDYCLPIDSYPNLLPDRSELPEGDEHPDDCVADLMKTSQSFCSNYYGWSWFSDVEDALEGYVQMVAPEYSATADISPWETFTWSGYRAEIDGGRPVVLLVDTDANGATDHFVTAIGYSDESGTNMYACRDTWDAGVHWFEFAEMALGQEAAGVR